MYCLEKYKLLKKEGYDNNNNTKLQSQQEVENAKNMLAIALVIFIIEFFLLFYAISTAIYWPVGSTLERFVHIFFAVFLTIPYILFTIVAKLVSSSSTTRIVVLRNSPKFSKRSRK
jgi:hypothetical protein